MYRLSYLALFLLALAFPSGAFSALFSISKPLFCAFVDKENDYEITNPAQNGVIQRSLLVDGFLYFSVIIVGNEKTFQYLEDKFHLGLNVHIWANGVKKDVVPIGITVQAWDENRIKLRNELDEMGIFTWRTYMKTRKINYSEIELILKDDSHQCVSLVSSTSSYRAKVKILP